MLFGRGTSPCQKIVTKQVLLNRIFMQPMRQLSTCTQEGPLLLLLLLFSPLGVLGRGSKVQFFWILMLAPCSPHAFPNMFRQPSNYVPQVPNVFPIWTTLIAVAQIWICITHKGGGQRKGSKSTSFTSILGECVMFQNFVVMGQSKWLLAKRQKIELWGPSPKLPFHIKRVIDC